MWNYRIEVKRSTVDCNKCKYFANNTLLSFNLNILGLVYKNKSTFIKVTWFTFELVLPFIPYP